QYSMLISNNGNTPLNLLVTNILPDVYTQNVFYTSIQTGLNVNLIYEDCANLTTTQAFPVNTSTSAPQYVKKANLDITNLLPGFNILVIINFNLASSCSGVPTAMSFPLHTAMQDDGDTSGYSQVCISCGSGGSGGDTAIYYRKPDIACF